MDPLRPCSLVQLIFGALFSHDSADEETTMGGAENIDRNILKSEYLINVDTEDGNAICIGCAGR